MDTNIAGRLSALRESLPDNVTLVAVSKTHSVELIKEAYNAGQRIFAENKVQEMIMKHGQLPEDIQWQFIGHVQRNKIRLMAPFVSLIQGIDSFSSLVETDRQAGRFGRKIGCLLQIHISSGDNKHGFVPDECISMLRDGGWRSLENISIRGVMGMASLTADKSQIFEEFQALTSFFHTVKDEFFRNNSDFGTISAGMSDDYGLAVKAGSNMVRIGTGIFGKRIYAPTDKKG